MKNNRALIARPKAIYTRAWCSIDKETYIHHKISECENGPQNHKETSVCSEAKHDDDNCAQERFHAVDELERQHCAHTGPQQSNCQTEARRPDAGRQDNRAQEPQQRVLHSST